MKTVKTTLMTLTAVAVVGWIGYRFYQAYQPEPVTLQGQIESQQYSISSKVPGRIDQVLVRKGDQVEKGQLIFTLLSLKLMPSWNKRSLARKPRGHWLKKQKMVRVNSRFRPPKINGSKPKRQQNWLKKTYLRVNNLYNDGVVSEQKRDEAQTQWQAAKYTESAALQMYQLAKEGAREETKQAALEKARMAAGAVAEVEAYAADTKIQSWFDGEVSQVLMHSGELAPQGFPVVTVVDTQDTWAVFNVREDLLKHFTQGAQFTAYLPALDKSIEFKVTHVAVMGDFATWRSTDATQGFDLRTFEVEARPVTPTEGLRMGMSVVVKL